MENFIRDKKSRFMANPIGDGKLMAKIINLHLPIKMTGIRLIITIITERTWQIRIFHRLEGRCLQAVVKHQG